MKKVIRIFGLATVVAALLVVSIGGAALAASGPQGGDAASAANGPQGGVNAPNCEGLGDCVCLCDGECQTNCEHYYGSVGQYGDDFDNGSGEVLKKKVRSGETE